jgi:hypothetical protein
LSLLCVWSPASKFLSIRTHETDEEAMPKIHREHHELVQFKLEYLAARDNPKKET